MGRTARRTQLLVFLVVATACVGCDHVAKHAAANALVPGQIVSIAGDALRFELVENPGAFLSLGATLPDWLRQPLLVGLVPLLLAAVCAAALAKTPLPPLQLLALGLIAGGGLGNWLDRLLYDGSVRDFVSLGVGTLRTGIFNLADVAIVAGAALAIFGTPREKPEPS